MIAHVLDSNRRPSIARRRRQLAMAGVLVPVPFPPSKKSNYNFVPQRKVIDYCADAVKTLEVGMGLLLQYNN